MSKEQFKNYEMTLKVVTPVHIGGGEGSKLNKLGYIHDKSNRKLFVLDTRKFTRFLMKNGKYESYINYIQRAIGTKNVNSVDNYKWINDNLRSKLNEVMSFSSAVFTNVKDERKFNDINLFTRTAVDTLYIPGSSIKGAIKTNITSDILVGMPENDRERIVKNFFNVLNPDQIRRQNKDLARIMSDIEKDIYEDKENNNKNIGITISDTYKSSNVSTNLLKDIDFVINKSECHQIPNFREYVLPESEFKFSLKLDTFFSKKIGIQSIEDLLKILNGSWKYLFEIGYFNNVSELYKYIPGKGNNQIILGANTGFHQKTIIHALTTDYEDVLEMSRFILHKKDNHKTLSHINDRNFSPRVLNLVEFQGKKTIAGVVKLEYREV